MRNGRLKYSSHKNWYTKYITKVQNLKNLKDKAYVGDVQSEEEILDQEHTYVVRQERESQGIVTPFSLANL